VLPSSQQAPNNDDEVVEVEPEEPVKILEMNGTFEDLVVWGHEVLPAADDTFVKGVEEWLQFAEAVCIFFFSLWDLRVIC
jgi:ribonuclease H2 subunit C